jgi:hypothetical protein
VDIAGVKKELSSDEKILESAFKLETLYKKYKFVIWGVAIALVLFLVGRTVMTSMEEARLAEANQALLSLQSNPGDAAAINVLKEKNPPLYELYRYHQAVKAGDIEILKTLSSSQNEVVADGSRYSAAVLENKTADSKLYSQMVLLEEAYAAIQSGEMKSAREKLELIDERSSLATVAQLLKHSTIKGN